MRNNGRDLHRCLCDTCGTSYEVFYCAKNGEYICKECLDKEEEENEEENRELTREEWLEKYGSVE